MRRYIIWWFYGVTLWIVAIATSNIANDIFCSIKASDHINGTYIIGFVERSPHAGRDCSLLLCVIKRLKIGLSDFSTTNVVGSL